MLQKIKEFFCRHKWSQWYFCSYSYAHYDEESWWQRDCVKCGAVEIEYEDGTKKLIRKENK